jgi:hypothetical protein
MSMCVPLFVSELPVVPVNTERHCSSAGITRKLLRHRAVSNLSVDLEAYGHI